MSDFKSPKIGFRVPTKCYCGEMLPDVLRSKALECVQDRMAGWFTGYDLFHIDGGWKPTPTSPVYKESVDYIVSSDTEGKWNLVKSEFEKFARDLATELTQGAIGCDIDGAFLTFKAIPPFTKCVHGKPISTPSDQPPVRDLLKLEKIERVLKSFKNTSSIRELFCGILNYRRGEGNYSTAKWPTAVRTLLIDMPEVFVDHNGFKVVYIRLAAEKLRRSDERMIVQRVIQDDPSYCGLFLVSTNHNDKWEFVNAKPAGDGRGKLLLRRIHVGIDEVRTATERMASVEIDEREESTISAQAIQERHNHAFDVETVTKEFYREIADWYFWALQHRKVVYPRNVRGEQQKSVFLIRLLTRLIFCWFLQEKGLIPRELFRRKAVAAMLKDFSPKAGTFYKAFLQNLFFATLNQEQGQREFRKKNGNRGATNLYRYADLLVNQAVFLDLLRQVPFVNGGLFDCLDVVHVANDNKPTIRLDDFSEEVENRLCIPNELFFGEQREIDLSGVYGDAQYEHESVRGLITVLDRYRFTIEESTPIDQEIALDPELLGRVFENLLASYNEDTKTTARKAVGAFYTPREIVSYMVDESLITYLKARVSTDSRASTDLESRLRALFAYDHELPQFTEPETESLITGIDSVKIVDPACGSGAFPMGILHKLVFSVE